MEREMGEGGIEGGGRREGKGRRKGKNAGALNVIVT